MSKQAVPKKPSVEILRALTQDHVSWATKATIASLVNTLKYISYVYYNTAQPLVSDKVFDKLKEILEKRDPKNKFLKTVGAPVTKNAVKLPYYMASLDKIVMDEKKLSRWLTKYHGPYVLSDKLDGVSALLTKNNDVLKMYSRGDGIEGQDISHLIKYVLPTSISNNLPNGIAIRGELIMSKKNFLKIKVKHELKNARNTVTGVTVAKKPTEEVAKLIEFLGYAVLSEKLKISEQFELLEKFKFPITTWKIKKNLDEMILKEYFNERLANTEYEIDGIVVIDDSKAYILAKENPDYGFAFKNKDVLESAEVEIKTIEWHATKDSYLVPTVIIEPVELDGVTITRATGHNAEFIKINKLGPGSIIKIIRSGSVIPHITDTIKGTGAQMPDVPEKDYKWSESGVDIIYTGKNKEILDEIASSYITSFFKKIGVKYLSEGIVTKLVGAGYKTPIDVLAAKTEDLYNIHGLGKKVVDKIYENIVEAFNGTKLETIMAASNIFGRGLGSKKLALIIKTYPNILEEKWNEKMIEEKVLAIKGFDILTARRFAVHVKEFKEFYKQLASVVGITLAKKPVKEIKKESTGSKANCINVFNEKSVVLTGTRKPSIVEYIESCGGKISDSVSKNTFLVIYADTEKGTGSGKYKKAQDLGIKLMTEEEFVEKYMK